MKIRHFLKNHNFNYDFQYYENIIDDNFGLYIKEKNNISSDSYSENIKIKTTLNLDNDQESKEEMSKSFDNCLYSEINPFFIEYKKIYV